VKYSEYPIYKDSGVEWLGNVPEHWGISRLKFLCNITTGGKDTENKVDNGDYPFYVRSQTVERINSYSFNGEAILTAGDGVGVGKVFHYTSGKFDFHQRVYMFYRFKRVVGQFLFEYIKNNFYKVALAGEAKSTVDSLRLPLIQNFTITVPSIQEQQAIANYLDKATAKIDSLIAKQTRLIELLKVKRQAVISIAVTRGLDSTVAMKDSGVEWLGEIPEHWDVNAIRRDLIEHKQGFYTTEPYIDYGVKLLRITDIKSSGHINYDKCPRVVMNPEDKHFLLKNGDFVFARTGGAGSFGCVTNLIEDVLFASYLIRFRFNSNLKKDFLKYYFLSMSFINSIESSIHGGVNKNIHAEDIKDSFIPKPSLSEQEVIVNYLDERTKKIDNLISKSAQGIDLLKEKRTALISSAVTGKIDVRNAL